MKLFGKVILSIAALAVLILVVLPVVWTQILTLIVHGADARHVLVRPGFLVPVVSNPVISILAALSILLAFGWGIRKLSR